MWLYPLEIRYTQDSISRCFAGEHGGKPIGQSLDELIQGKISIYDFPEIEVFQVESEWFSNDNRRLWVFKMAATLGVLEKIPVVLGECDDHKFTTKNGGYSITIRGNAGGFIWKTMPKVLPDHSSEESDSDESSDEDEYYESDLHEESLEEFW